MLFDFETNIYEKPISKLYDLDEGFTKGNMFPELYDTYKDYKPKTLKPKTEREALLYSIDKLCFAINDLNLYLDVYPDDKDAYETFKKYCMLYDRCLEEYESKYQVLNLSHDVYGKYTWISNPWPWEDRKNV